MTAPGAAALLPLLPGGAVLCAAVAVLLPWPLARRLLLYAATLASTAAGVALLVAHHSHPVLAVQTGGFAPGVAIAFVSDSLTALMIAATGLVTLAALWFCDATGELARSRWFAPLALLLLAGVDGALLTGDLFNLFVFVEVMLLPSYALVAMTGERRRIAVGRLFVVVNLLTSTLLLAGVGLVYAVAGTVNLAALEGAGAHDGRLAAAVGVVLVALGIKAGCVPVHGWLPRSYPGTSAGVMALFAGLHTKVALYAMVRIWATVLGLDSPWAVGLLAVAAVTALGGAAASAAPGMAREVLAWQMVSGVGVILCALAAGAGGGADVSGPAGALAYTLHHMLTIGVLVLAVGAAEATYRTGRLERFGDLWHRDRALGVLLAFGIASLVGLPMTSGLVAKLEVVRAGLDAHGAAGPTVVAVVLVSSLVGLLAMLRLWRGVMWGREDAAEADRPRVPLRLLLPGAALAVASAAMFLGYGAVAPEIDRAVGGLVDTTAYRDAVLPTPPPRGAR